MVRLPVPVQILKHPPPQVYDRPIIKESILYVEAVKFSSVRIESI